MQQPTRPTPPNDSQPTPDTVAELPRRVAVLGLGTMGHGIAQAMATAGCTVTAFDSSGEARATLSERMQANLQRMAAAGLVPQAEVPAIVARVRVEKTIGHAVADAQFVTEAVSEDLEVKQQLFAELERTVEPATILASNTSSYPISQIAQRMESPQRALVTHWFNPPHIIPVVEVVPGPQTAATTLDVTCELLARIGKSPVRLQQELPGFLVNRVQIAMFREIWDLLDRGVATAAEIDRAIRGSMGMRLAALGPFAIIDFAGWDVTARVYENLIPHQRGDTEMPPRIRQLVEAGHLGVKSGQGIYEYTAESAQLQREARDQAYLELLKLLHRS